MEKILNLTQHPASKEQVEQGVVDPGRGLKAKIRKLITFNELPARNIIAGRALALAGIVEALDEFRYTMIGGAPFFMSALESELKAVGVTPLYAFSKRIVEEKADGSEKKVLFRHEGFVEI